MNEYITGLVREQLDDVRGDELVVDVACIAIDARCWAVMFTTYHVSRGTIAHTAEARIDRFDELTLSDIRPLPY
jgi:hypothetical protein